MLCVFRLYLRYNHWLPQVLLYVFILVDLSLALFEEPAVFALPTWVRRRPVSCLQPRELCR